MVTGTPRVVVAGAADGVPAVRAARPARRHAVPRATTAAPGARTGGCRRTPAASHEPPRQRAATDLAGRS
ncbi:hypothetical protein [Streptomyces sp. NPDC059788]|uniref:hypothetical protein n=1 Tax=Streptomyces sp. NPDC059788 TaxID=3346948 RepID=UPI00366348BA